MFSDVPSDSLLCGAMYILKEAKVVNEGKILETDILVQGERIERIDPSISVRGAAKEVYCKGNFVLPGVIDDQVHFREPGLTHKATIATESRAAVLGGVTSYFEMPNTVPAATDLQALEDKYAKAKTDSYANYSFFLGATNQNLQTILDADFSKTVGVKAFLGSSTGNLLMDDPEAIRKLFGATDAPIAVHSEDDKVVQRNAAEWKDKTILPANIHEIIRSVEACYVSTERIVRLARELGTRLHVLHITSEKELALFDKGPVEGKRITAEVCVHHLHFSAEDYDALGDLVKCNPSIKAPENRAAIWKALLEDRIDIIATDHAPHTAAEKALGYWNAPAGLPLVQHGLSLMLRFVAEGKLSILQVVEKMCHNPAILFAMPDRGYIREGYYADLVQLEARPWVVRKDNIAYKCGWSPLEGVEMPMSVQNVWVSGTQMVLDGAICQAPAGQRLTFKR